MGIFLTWLAIYKQEHILSSRILCLNRKKINDWALWDKTFSHPIKEGLKVFLELTNDLSFYISHFKEWLDLLDINFWSQPLASHRVDEHKQLPWTVKTLKYIV